LTSSARKGLISATGKTDPSKPGRKRENGGVKRGVYAICLKGGMTGRWDLQGRQEAQGGRG